MQWISRAFANYPNVVSFVALEVTVIVLVIVVLVLIVLRLKN